MFKLSFIPQEKRIFDLFQAGVDNLKEAALKQVEMMEDYQDVEDKVAVIIELEHRGDSIIHDIMNHSNRTFVLPLDREDITLLAQRLDDVVDFIEGAARAMLDYKIEAPTESATQLAVIIAKAAEELTSAISRLRYRKAQLREILAHCVEINRLENEADVVFRSALAHLFDNTNHIADIMKWREMYDQLEGATDRGEDAANVLEAIVLKHA